MQIRVTEPLNFFKEQWYIDWVHKVGRTEANKISKRAMALGTRVDELIKLRCATAMTKDSVETHSCIAAFNKWMAVYQPKEIVNGERLYTIIDGHEVSGEPDIYVDDVLVDIKCATKISPSYWVQVNMYRYLKCDTGSKVGILRLDKTTGSYEYVVKDYDPRLVNVWMGLMRAMVYYKGEAHDGVDVRETGSIKEVA